MHPLRPLRTVLRRSVRAAGIAACLLVLGGGVEAGSIFLTGHDPDFHARQGGNAVGARNINNVAINFIRDPGFNPFTAIAPKFLYVQSNIAPPGGHINGKLGILDSGYTEGVDFDHHDATTLLAALGQLGQPGGYSAIVIASDFGGILTQAELDILNNNQAAVATFLNMGGGLYAMAESNSQAMLTPNGGHFSYIPTVVASSQFNQTESGFTVTAFGASLGLTNADINGNASHNIFTSTGGLTPVDLDAAGNIMSLAGREQVIPVEETTWGRIKRQF